MRWKNNFSSTRFWFEHKKYKIFTYEISCLEISFLFKMEGKLTSILLKLDESNGPELASTLHSSLPLSAKFKADNVPSKVLTSIKDLKIANTSHEIQHQCTFFLCAPRGST